MSLARDITTVGSATLASRLLGFGRDMGIAAVLGAGAVSDAFFAVLQIVNFFRRLLAEGALNAAFVPLWLRIKQAEGASGALRFFYDVFRIMALAVVALAVIGLLFAPAVIGLLAPGFEGERHVLAADYLHSAAPYVVFAGVIAVVAAALNAEGRVLAVAIGTVAFNAVLLLVLAWTAIGGPLPPPFTAAILAHAIVLAGLVQLVVTGAAFVRLKPMTSHGASGYSPEARRFFALAVPGL